MITQDFFKSGKLCVPNTVSETGGYEDNDRGTELEAYITKYEKDFFKRLLGSKYSEYAADKTAEERDTKWVALETKLLTDTNESPIANYIFWHYYSESTRRNTETGTVVPTSDTQNYVTNSRLCEVWNDMVQLMYSDYDCILEWVTERQDTYNLDYSTVDWYNFTHTINTLGI